MRDLEEDFSNHRIYLPEEFLMSRELGSILPEARAELFKRALEFRSQAKPYSWKCLPAELMAAIYLEGAQKYWRWGNPKRLSRFQKAKVIVKTIFVFTFSRSSVE